jgi:NDP-sugar pyrophosphorylase family protein
MKHPSSMTQFAAETPVVILAGGQGTRLRPYTTTLPKPLMPVGNYPIMEILLRQLASYGFRDITLAVGYLSGLIQAYFKDGKELGLNLTYGQETKPLGTAGPLAQLPRFDSSILVLNGDLLTNLDFRKIVRYHYANEATATVAMTRRQEAVDFGVIETDDENQIVGFKEKPERSFLVSMGIYVFTPQVLNYIPKSTRVDFPELLERLMSHEKKIVGFESNDYWMDIGRPDDYDKANEDFPAMEREFLNPHVEHETIRVAV